MTVRSVVIIGSGPAGLTAAIYAARADLKPLVIEGQISSTSDQPGGQLMLTTDIENFPGFPKGISGPELVASFRDQAERFGAEFITERATSVDLTSLPFKVETSDQQIEAASIIIAMGAQSKMLGLEAETRLLGRGLSTCATCDGFFFRGKEVAVIGGGDSALEEATFLTKFADKVTVVHRRHELRASKIMQDRAFSNPKIAFKWGCEVANIVGNEKVEGLLLKNRETGEEETLSVSGVFVAIGHTPNSSLFTGKLDMTDAGYIRPQGRTSHTSVEGVFVCGDVQDSRYRQAITAAGSGCMAAIDAERWLESTHEPTN